MTHPHHPTLHFQSITPTVFFVQAADGLQQGVDVRLENTGGSVTAELLIRLGPIETRLDLGSLTPGASTQRIYIPDLRQPTPVEFTLSVSGQVQDQTTVNWTPQRHWQIYLVHSSHHDLGYTDLPSNLLREHDRFLDDVLRFCDETADWPADSRFHYLVEQAWSILHYLEHRSPAQVEKLVLLLREGRIEVTALMGNETSELCGHEGQVRLLYPAFRLKRRYGVPIRTAELNDIPGIAWGLASVLAGAGIRYFAPGIPDYFAWGRKVRPIWDEAAVLPRDLPGAFWWEGPDGGRVLFWYEGGFIGTPSLWTVEQAEKDLPLRLMDITGRGYPYDLIRMKFLSGERDNSPPDLRLSHITRQWNERWVYPRLVVSTNARFFERFEREFGGGLRLLRGDLPNTDYPIGATSTPHPTGVNRLAHDALTSAEKLAACAAHAGDYDYPAETLAEAYDTSLLYDEHTWGMAHPLGPAQDACLSQKTQYAYRAAALAQDVLSKSTNRIADGLRLSDDGYHVTVFNPLSYARSDVVHVLAVPPAPCGRPMHWRNPAPGEAGPVMFVHGTALGRNLINLPPDLLEKPFTLVDLTTGRSVPYQVVTLDDPLSPHPLAAQRYALGHVDPASLSVLNYDRAHLVELVFVAEDVPGMGYKTYRLIPAPDSPVPESSLQIGENWMESRFYKIIVDSQTGAISSLFDKQMGREWVDPQAPHGFNQLVARRSKTGVTSVPAHSRVTRGEKGPVYASLIIQGDGPGCPQRTQEIILYDAIKRVDLYNRILRDATPLLELYFAFPFAVDQPRFRFEAGNAVIEPIRDQLPGTNTAAYAVQHWVNVDDDRGGVTWSSLEAPVVALGSLWPSPVSQAHHGASLPGFDQAFLRDPSGFQKGTIYSYAAVNNFRTNFQPVQVGEALFRYSLTTHAGDFHPGSTRDFGWSASTPLEPVILLGPQDGKLPVSGSFCQVDPPDALLLTLKAAEDGDGLIIRLAGTQGRPVQATIALPFYDVASAIQANLVEEDDRPLPFDRHSLRVTIPADGLVTVRCRGSRFPVASRFDYN